LRKNASGAANVRNQQRKIIILYYASRNEERGIICYLYGNVVVASGFLLNLFVHCNCLQTLVLILSRFSTVAAMTVPEESQFPMLKPIACTYNPSPSSLPMRRELPGFSFLKSESSGDGFTRSGSSIEVDPVPLGIPWPTSFLVARQCKHWIAAIQSGQDLLWELYYLSSADEKKLPQGLFTASDPIYLSKRGNAAVENAVNAAIYMNPEANQTKILLIVRAYLLLWLLGGKGSQVLTS
jgi:hypothetical protein